ncbi:MAG: ATP-binding protein [Nanoarchaeota archaeon]|nr:ATP-binding protein [Nanoarchaeota archaeon]
MSDDTYDGNGRDPGKTLETLLSGDSFRRIREQTAVEEAREARQGITEVLYEFRPFYEVMRELVNVVKPRKEAINARLKKRKELFSKRSDEAFSEVGDEEGFGIFAFAQGINREFMQLTEPLYKKLFSMTERYERDVEEVMRKQQHTLTDLKRMAATTQQIITEIPEQIVKGLLEYEKLVTGTYLAIKRQHKRLRGRYAGLEDKEEQEGPDEILARIFGGKAPEKPPARMRIAMIDDNCFLTDTLLALAEDLPHHYESTITTRRGTVKNVKKLDDYEIEQTAQKLIYIADEKRRQLLATPGLFTESIGNMMIEFYLDYKQFEGPLRKIITVVEQLPSVRVAHSEGVNKPFPNPEPILRRLQRLDFANIRATAEELQPRNKREKDYAQAQTKLLEHLADTIQELGEYQEPTTQLEQATAAVKTAITLKETLDDIEKTERERRQKKDISKENEFYVGTKGHAGQFSAEREPTPDVKLKDVAGASFEKAKQHIEEVIGLTTHPRLLRATAPRGKIKSNLLLIGPYGCGKTEFARGIAADRRVIGLYVGVSDVLTAYMHESVNNVRRVWEEAKKLRQNSRETKPVIIIQDEFDAWFQESDMGFRNADGPQMERTLQEVLDGVVDYEGVITVAMTNNPGAIPDAILRRFKYVDIVGQLTTEERATLLERFMKKMPIARDVTTNDYQRWAEQLTDAPGDVLGKVADEVHFKYLQGYLATNRPAARKLEQQLARQEKKQEEGLTPADYRAVRQTLGDYRKVTREEINLTITDMLTQPAIRKTINIAKKVYEDAEKIKAGMAEIDPDAPSLGFGGKEKSTLWTPPRR